MFLVCGEALFDLFLTGDEGPGVARFDARAGGSPFNVAIGMARLGAEVGLFTGLSDDLLGKRLEAMLRAEGVDTRYLVRSGRRTTLSVVGADDAGQPSYAFYGVGSADSNIETTDLPTLDERISGLHLGSYTLVVPPVADALAVLVETRGDRFVSLDPNIRATVEPDMDVWRRRVEALLPGVDAVKVSEEDLMHLHPGHSPDDVAREWLARGPALVVVTGGGGDVRGHTATETVTVRAPTVQVVDTVGAGDTFQAALLMQLDKGGEPRRTLAATHGAALAEMLEFAARAAALTCTRRGANLPRLAEVLAFGADPA